MKYRQKTATARGTLMVLAVLAPLIHLQGDTLTYEGFDIPPGEVDNTMGATSWGWGKILGIYDRTWLGCD